MNKRKGITIGTVAILFIGALLLFAVPRVAYRDWRFICEKTASQKGYRESSFGLRTRHWYYKSPLEAFIETNAPGQLQHKWTSYAGTGYDMFGYKVLYGHGRPGPILFFGTNELTEWFNISDDRERRAFYDLLVSRDQEAIRCKIYAIDDQLIERASTSPR